MAETRLVTFRLLKDICAHIGEDYSPVKDKTIIFCCHDDTEKYGVPCTAANCPVWKKLKVIERQ